MKRSRLLALIIGVGVLLLLGLTFRQFVFDYVVAPLATVLWLLLRMFVLSIDQQVYWWVLILLAGLLAFLRLRGTPAEVESYAAEDTNPTLANIDHWRLFLISDTPNLQANFEDSVARRELIWLLTSIYASRQQDAASYQVRQALESGEIPLPPEIHAILFPPEPGDRGNDFFRDPVGTVRSWLKQLLQAPQRYLRRWNGQETADYYRRIDAVLSVMETSLEIRHDDDPNTPNPY